MEPDPPSSAVGSPAENDALDDDEEPHGSLLSYELMPARSRGTGGTGGAPRSPEETRGRTRGRLVAGSEAEEDDGDERLQAAAVAAVDDGGGEGGAGGSTRAGR